MSDPYAMDTLESDPEFTPTAERIWTFRRDWFRSDIRVGDDFKSPTMRDGAIYRVIEVNDKTLRAVQL